MGNDPLFFNKIAGAILSALRIAPAILLKNSGSLPIDQIPQHFVLHLAHQNLPRFVLLPETPYRQTLEYHQSPPNLNQTLLNPRLAGTATKRHNAASSPQMKGLY